ncbi:MAG: response regulator transcription factor [Chloroflexi bacterium]|nr:response regulator transcription factor [Chloroflexota bacterium]
MSKILLVDDDTDFVRAMTIRLRAAGYDVVFAGDGYSATVKARQEEPDLILLDIGLPAGNGFAIIKRIRQLISPLAMVPIIVLTARDPLANRELALQMGADAFFQKPADNAALLAKIEELIGQSKGGHT